MLDARQQVRFTRCCTDAAFGYTAATMALLTQASARNMELWAGMVCASLPKPDAPRSWFVPPGRDHRPDRRPVAAWSWPTTGWEGQGFNPFLPFWGQSPATTPMIAWWSMLPLQGAPACWPMAYSMIAAGVPGSVAWPTAKANAAALDAAEIVTDQINTAFSSYRSESGFAAAQIVSPKQAALALAMFGPATALLWPWLRAMPTTMG